MSSNPDEIQAMLDSAAKHFAGKEVVESVLLVSRDAFKRLAKSIRDARITVLVLQIEMEPKHLQMIKDAGGDESSFACIKMMVETKDAGRLFAAMADADPNMVKTDIANQMIKTLAKGQMDA